MAIRQPDDDPGDPRFQSGVTRRRVRVNDITFFLFKLTIFSRIGLEDNEKKAADPAR
jgi:hypothetical protein